MDIPNTYHTIANWYFLAGNKVKAVETQVKAIEAATLNKNFPEERLKVFEAGLQKYLK